MADILQPSFWDDEEGELYDALDELLIVALMDGIDGGTSALPANYRVLVDFDRVNQNALRYATDYRYRWIKGINDTTRTQTQQAIADWIREGTPLSALEAKLESIYGKARAERIATTEVTRVYAIGNQAAFEATEIVDSVIWQTVNDGDVCPICDELDDTEIGIGDIDAMPPAHVGCRCFALPHVSEELVSEKIDRILS